MFDDGRSAPAPLRSGRYPEGLPTLTGKDADRVQRDNAACDQRGLGGAFGRTRPIPSTGAAEEAMLSSGEYSSCVFASARRKSPRLRRNVEEILSWPPLSCQHFHAPDEWDPMVKDGKTVYLSKEEAEYNTAPLAFSIAIAASWWAACVYVGSGVTHGCRGTRATLQTLRCTEFVVTELYDQLKELAGMTLRCDCPVDCPCEADVLAGLLFEQLQDSPPPHHPKPSPPLFFLSFLSIGSI